MLNVKERTKNEMAEREFRKALRLGKLETSSIVVPIPKEFRKALQIYPKTNLRLDLVDGVIMICNADLLEQPKGNAKR